MIICIWTNPEAWRTMSVSGIDVGGWYDYRLLEATTAGNQVHRANAHILTLLDPFRPRLTVAGPFNIRLLTMDISDLATMKNAAKCDT